MKIESTVTKTVVGGTTHTPQKFTIDANQISFIVLSSRMYNDPKRAIIRELACNAWDAHVMAGKKDVPFEIHLPTDFEPYFRITDHGIGMSHDDVMNLYCTYFASSKNSSNQCIGAMGLGSKSPFCYTISHSGTLDATGGFTVVSWFSGMKRIYSAYVENGTPTIVCLSEAETTEINGFEVEFAANTNDVWEFENKAKLALEFFDPMPIINIEGFQPVKAEYLLKTDRWGLRKDAHTAETSGLRAIQGNVQYAVGSIDSTRMSPEQQAVYKLPLDIFFPIGDLSVASNREMLSNDQRTLNNILDALTEVHKGVSNEIRKQLESCTQAWDARIRLINIMQQPVGEIVRQAYNSGDFFVKYPNFTLPKENPNLYELDFEFLQLTKYLRTASKGPRKASLFTKKTKEAREFSLQAAAANPSLKRTWIREIEVDAKVAFIYNDLGRSGNKFITAYVQGGFAPSLGIPFENYCRTAYVFSPTESWKNPKHVKKDLTKALKALGNPTCILASWIKETYPDIVKVAEKVSKPRLMGILEATRDGETYRYGSHSGWLKRLWSVVPQADLPAGRKFYVTVESKRMIGDRFNRAVDFVNFINNVKQSKLFDVPQLRVFGLTAKDIKLLGVDGNKDWVPFVDYVIDQAQAIITPDVILELSIRLQPFNCHYESLLRKIVAKETEFANSPLFAFAKGYLKASAERHEVSGKAAADIVQVLEKWGKYTRPGTALNFEKAWTDLVLDRYPVLGIKCNEYGMVEGANYNGILLGYVRLMDRLMDSQKEAI
jgi:hypothetical protein